MNLSSLFYKGCVHATDSLIFRWFFDSYLKIVHLTEKSNYELQSDRKLHTKTVDQKLRLDQKQN